MKQLTVALLQILPGGTQAENLKKGIEACRAAKRAGADLALFPEMWNNGYHIPRKMQALRAEAVAADSQFVMTFGALASELEMAIAVTFLESFSPSPRNTVVLFDRMGRRVLTYAKVHTCEFGLEGILTPGENFYTADLDTQSGNIRVGAMICYDREFPEAARILMLQGAEIILVPNACPMEINRLSQLRGRAFENMLGIATCNYPSGKSDCNGHSSAFDGVAYLPDLPGSRDTCLLEAGEEEGIYLATFDLERLRSYRRCEVHGNAYRHPGKYHPLIDEAVCEPFIRHDRRR